MGALLFVLCPCKVKKKSTTTIQTVVALKVIQLNVNSTLACSYRQQQGEGIIPSLYVVCNTEE